MAENRKRTFKRILKQLKNYRFLLCMTILFAIITVAGTLFVPILFGQVIDLMLPKVDNFADVYYKFVLIAIVVAITCVAQWAMNIVNNHIAYNVVKDIREEAFANIQRLPLSYIDNHSYGDLVGRAIADVDQFADGLLMGFTQLFTGVLTILGTLAIMFVLNWVIALIVFVITPLSLFVAKFIASRTYSLFKNTSQIRGEQTAFIDEMVGNLKVVKAFNREDENLEKFDDINSRLTSASLKSIFFSSLTNPSTRFVNSVVYAAVALSGALMLALSTPLPIVFSVGILSSLLSYANQYTKPFNEISGVVTELQNAIACASRIYEVIDAEPQVPDREGAVELCNPKGDIEFNAVDFSYTHERELIKNLNLSVKAGQRIAIVGPTGCGKTTLINLLMRFYDPDSGEISVDGNNAMDITRDSLRKNYGMVLQDTWLKSGTVRENIAMGKPDASEEEIYAAAKLRTSIIL